MRREGAAGLHAHAHHVASATLRTPCTLNPPSAHLAGDAGGHEAAAGREVHAHLGAEHCVRHRQHAVLQRLVPPGPPHKRARAPASAGGTSTSPPAAGGWRRIPCHGRRMVPPLPPGAPFTPARRRFGCAGMRRICFSPPHVAVYNDTKPLGYRTVLAQMVHERATT